MYIHVKNLTGTTSVYLIGNNESVRLLKTKIMLREGIPIENQRLVLNDKELTDDMSLQAEGVTEDSEVHLVVAMRGGPYTLLRSTALSDEEEDFCESDANPPFEAIEECLRKYEKSLGSDSSPPAVIYLMYESKGDMHIIKAYRINDEASPNYSSSTNHINPLRAIASDTNAKEVSNLRQKMSLLRLKMDSKRLNKRFTKTSPRGSLNPYSVLPNIASSGNLSLSSSSASALKPQRSRKYIQHLSEINENLPNLQRCISHNGSTIVPSSKQTFIRKTPRLREKSFSYMRPQTAYAYTNSLMSQSCHFATTPSQSNEATSAHNNASGVVNAVQRKHSPLPDFSSPPITSTAQCSETSSSASPSSSSYNVDGACIQATETTSGIESRITLPDLTRHQGKPERTSCHVCKKRLKLVTTFQCRCGLTLCQKHLYPEEHTCSIDYKEEGKAKLQNENPFISPKKLPQV